MSFTLICPHCGARPAIEYAYLGEQVAPAARPTLDPLSDDLYLTANVAGVQLEWWFHRFGCERWLLARRDTRTNDVHDVWAADDPEAPTPDREVA